MKLTSLKPSIRTLGSRIPTLSANPHATPRLRGRAGVKRRASWLERHPLCVHCLAEDPPRTTAAVTPDHIVPLEQGGADDENNLQSLCKKHHDAKNAAEAAARAGR